MAVGVQARRLVFSDVHPRGSWENAYEAFDVEGEMTTVSVVELPRITTVGLAKKASNDGTTSAAGITVRVALASEEALSESRTESRTGKTPVAVGVQTSAGESFVAHPRGSPK